MSRPDRPNAAFSLVEVTLALGIMAFCLVAIFGLLPTGLNTSRDAIAQTAAANIAAAIAADLRQTPAATAATPTQQSPRFLIAVPPGSALYTSATTPRAKCTLFFTEEGAVATSNPAVNTQTANADPTQNPRYRAYLEFNRQGVSVLRASTDRAATTVRILVTWPALADPTGGIAPKNMNSSFETMIALDRN